MRKIGVFLKERDMKMVHCPNWKELHKEKWLGTVILSLISYKTWRNSLKLLIKRIQL